MRTTVRALSITLAVVAAHSPVAVASVAPHAVITSPSAAVLTVDVRAAVTIDATRMRLQASRAAVFYVRGLKAGSPAWGVVVLPEIGEPDVVPLGKQTVRLSAGRYEFSLLSSLGSRVDLPVAPASLRIVKRRALPAPQVTTADLAGPAGTALGAWSAAVSTRPGALVVAALRAVFTAPVAADAIDVCVAPLSLPCSAQDGYGISYVNTRSVPIEETDELVYSEESTKAETRTAQAHVLGADTVKAARVVVVIATTH